MHKVFFWNGNKSVARQSYELALLQACLKATNQEYASVELRVDNTDYPSAKDEANIFSNGADILVTVAGNLKFKNIQKWVITQPITKGLLGYRLLIVRDELLPSFSQVIHHQQLQVKSIGIPQTWADAELFRYNQYRVVEKGNFDELFMRLKNAEFDYVALGVNEIEEIFKNTAAPLGGLSLEPSLMLYYPFPLVFYVAANQARLAHRVETGLNKIIASGEFEVLFKKHHGGLVQRLNLKDRKTFTLTNPELPIEFKGFSSSLLD
ncbi:hypothetical protein [Paraglaciecola arctica]|uniref:hypothetical protein n=1 Tax=Paraglaciecola arctica TaxID=1128911 RepID=UPI001C074B59|nr:hypothetical protein [Paraglaciecola arctica]MBU3003846.1 hypothetical protein [Paraglaciecola arctica]